MGTEKKEGQSNGNIMHRICRVQGYVVCLSFNLHPESIFRLCHNFFNGTSIILYDHYSTVHSST